MRKLFNHIILITIISFGFNGNTLSLKAIPCADTKGGSLIAEDTTRCINEPTILTLRGSIGQITWLTRLSGAIAWSVIPGETDTIITVQPEADREYAALLTGSCTDTSSFVALHVSNFATIPYPGFGGEACGYYFSLSAFPVYQPLTGYWSQISGPDDAEFYPSSEQYDPDSVTVETIGIYKFAWNITDGICTKDSVIEIEVLEQPVANAGSDTNQCGREFHMNAKINIPGATGEWYKVSGAGTFTFKDETLPNSLVNANPGTYSIRWTERNSTCEDDTIIEINVAYNPVANAGLDESSCADSFKLQSFPSIGLGNWKQISGPGTANFDNSNLPNAWVTVNNYGENYQFQWKETNSFCSDSDTVIINFYEQPVALTSDTDDACGHHTKLIARTSTESDSVLRSWLFINGPFEPNEIIHVNDSSAFVNIAPGYYGEYLFRWKEVNGTCADSIDIPVNFFEQPIAMAGENIEICGLNGHLNANASMENSLKNWSVLNDEVDIIFSDESNPQAEISSDLYGSYLLIWEETNQICSDTDTIEVDFYKIPVANPGSGGDTCGYNFALNATQSISNSIGYWSILNNSDTNQFANSPKTTAHVDSAGSYYFLWTENNNGCIDQNSVEVTFYYQPEATILEAEDACGYEQVITTTPLINTQSEWYINSDFGTAVVSDIADNKYKILASDTGKYNVKWQIFNEQCSDDTLLMIHFYQEPDISAGEDMQICGDNTSLNATTNLGTGSWLAITRPGNILLNEPSNPSTSIIANEFGIYTLRWKVQHGACITFDDTELEFIEPPSAYAGTDENICNLTYTLSADPPNGFWSVLKNESNLQVDFAPDLEKADAMLSVDSAGSLTLAWITSNVSCVDSSQVTLNFVGSPTANAGPDQELDNIFETSMQAETPSDSFEGEWFLYSGSGIISSPKSPFSDIYNLELGENLFIWKVKNEYCEAFDTVEIKIYDIFIPEVITPNGDNENDYFVIRGIQNVGSVEVIIFNRWGIEVYSNDDYQNDWGGTNKNGNLLTNDTYFYVINIANDRIFKGFVVIKK